MSPRLSVLVPVRNGLPYLEASLDSILAQSFADFELVVVDDGSADGSRDVAASTGDPRVRVVDGGGRGVAHALNVALGAARGELVARQDADDLSAPGRLARQVEYLDRHPDITLVASRASFVDEAGAAIDTPWTRAVEQRWDAALTPDAIAALMPLTCCLVHGSVMARRAALVAAGGYDERSPVEDYDLWLRLLPEHRFAKLDERLYCYRVHPAQVTASLGTRQAEHAVAAKLRYLRRLVPALPRRARLALPCADRGAGVFRLVAPREGFDIASGRRARSCRGADVVAVTDFEALPRYRDELVDSGGYRQVGNLFIRPPLGRRATVPASS